MNEPLAPRPLVLIAEDEPSLRDLLRLVLDGAGYDALLCPDGLAAAEELDRVDHIALVMMDLRMPRLSGEQLLAIVRAHPRHAPVPVIAMSAFSDDQQARDLLAAGAAAFLPKPFTVAQVLDTVARVLRAR